jgi:hypothetical protein
MRAACADALAAAIEAVHMMPVQRGGPTDAVAPLESWRYAVDVWERGILFLDVG